MMVTILVSPILVKVLLVVFIMIVIIAGINAIRFKCAAKKAIEHDNRVIDNLKVERELREVKFSYRLHHKEKCNGISDGLHFGSARSNVFRQEEV